MTPIKNKYHFKYILMCKYSNPNGNPEEDNAPRMDPETLIGYITDVATKRRVRDFINIAHGDEPGMGISVRNNTNLNCRIAEAKEGAGVELSDTTNAAIEKTVQEACRRWFDARTFGQVMAQGPKGGQIRGPVQICFGESIDPIQPQDIQISCVAKSIDVKAAKSYADYQADEDKMPAEKLRNFGRKQVVPFALYVVTGSISAYQAEKTGFDEQDLRYFFEALANMYETTQSASKGMLSVVSPVVIFKHVGNPGKPAEERENQAKLGCAPMHKLLELVRCEKKPDCDAPRDYRDYDCEVDISKLPKGVEIGFLPSFADGITWGRLPDGEDWVVAK